MIFSLIPSDLRCNVDIRKGHQFNPECLKISPNGKTPSIGDPDYELSRALDQFWP